MGPENVPEIAKIFTEEAFGPVAILSKFSTWDEALESVNNSKFGLQAGVFTRDYYKIQRLGMSLRSAVSWSVMCQPIVLIICLMEG